MKQYWKLFAAMLTLFAVSIFGQCPQECCNPCGQDCCNCRPCNTCTNTCSTCCSSPCCCNPCDFVPPCPPDICGYNAPEIIDIKCGWDIFVTASFVYAQAKQENLEFMEVTFSESNTIGNDTITNQNTEYSQMCFDYNPAFKVGLGFTFGCDNWILYAEYFRYHANSGKGSLAKECIASNMVIFPYFFPININVSSFKSSSKWRLDLDTVDFLLGRNFYVGKCLTFFPKFGIRAAWIDQSYQNTLNTTFIPDTVSFTETNEEATLSSCSWAVGAKAALDTSWKFCGGFYFFGDTSLDILYTDYERKDQRKTSSVLTVNGVVVQNINTEFEGSNPNKFCFLRPHAQIGLGLGWKDYFCCNDWHLDFRFGYEFHLFWNQNVLPVVADCVQDPSRLYGNLDLNGLVITARLDF